ncbi:MAG: acyl-CoA dehydrogenase family protein [Candidatus Neomarinimicrobiota bacterium]
MSDNLTYRNTGGRFLTESIGSKPVFIREKFNDEQKEILQMVSDFAAERIRPNREKLDAFNKELTFELFQELGELGILSIDIPEQYGGMELDKITSALVVEALSGGYDASFTATFTAHVGIGSLPIVWFGTPEQKAKFLPKLGSGEWMGAYALTEPSSGSDALSAKTTAILSEDGQHYIMNGEKQFITNGGWATVFTVFAQVDGSKFSAFILERGMPGFEIGPEEKKMGMKGSSTVALKFTDCKVPVGNLLYEVGKGATIAFNALNLGRFKLAAADLGGCKGVIGEAVKYALERRQFGQPIAHFDAIKGKVADMVIRTYSSDSMAYRTIGLIQDEIDTLDKKAPDYYLQAGEATERFAIEASMAKVYVSESFGFCADTGIQILGGYGFSEEYPMAAPFRDTRIDRIWEGTNEINRQIITGYMMKKALMEELPVRDYINTIEAFLNGDEEIAADGLCADEIKSIEAGKRLAASLFNEALCEYGQDLKHQQQLMEILANMFTLIYTADSTISRVRQVIAASGMNQTLVDIARVHAAEVSIQLMNMALAGWNGVYRGNLPQEVMAKLRTFQRHMLPKTDILGLKRQIAEAIYAQQRYPF